MRPRKLTMSLETPALDNVCQDQTTVGAGDLTINGSLASGGTVSLDSAHRLDLESTGNISGVTFTITGTDAQKHPLVETIAGPNNNTVTTTGYFKTITSISVDGAVGTNTSIGTTDEAVTQVVPLNYRSLNFKIGFGVDISGTINYTVQHTFDNILAGETPTYFNHDSLVSETSDQDGNYMFGVMGMRLVVNSFSAGATLSIDIIQGN